MGSFTTILCLFAAFLIIDSVSAAGSCPLASKIYSCSPKCQQNYDCSHGKICCPNGCNAKSCIDANAFGSSGNNDKRTQSGGPGVYCNNVKCSAFEVCKMDPATKRMKCVRA
uniref:WAP four-disulfide core domain protein 2 n=1 Tax=Papilio polytes TaxID=76194 RepID=I4DME0_PAPPL|nr:WAP four-disulfide core domain protein 2 precursor [Papilio polytes]